MNFQGVVIPCIGCRAERPPLQSQAKCNVHGYISAACMAALEPKCIALYFAALCDEHRKLAAMALHSFAECNATSIEAVMAKLEELWK